MEKSLAVWLSHPVLPPLLTVLTRAARAGERWPEIATLNGISKANPYRLGDCLKLPKE